MNRTVAALLVILVGCAAEAPPNREEPPPAALLDPEPPPPAAAVADSEDSEDETPLPDSIPLGASITRSDPAGGPPVSVSSTDGKPVPWIRTEVTRTPLPFDRDDIRAKCDSSWVLGAGSVEPERIRLDCLVRGLPKDAHFLELVPGDSFVEWEHGKRGTIDSIFLQRWSDDRYSLDVLTSPPPVDPGIRTARIALRVHQSARADRYEASIGVGDVARFDFGVLRLRWILPSDLRLTEFGAGGYGKPITPLFEGGLRYSSLVQLVDSRGVPLRRGGGGGAGTQFINEWSGGGDSPLVPPVRIIVEIPSVTETKTTPVVLSLQDIKPRR